MLQKYVARDENIARPAGYAALIQRYRLELPQPRHVSSIGPGSRERQVTPAGIHESFPEQFDRDTSDVGQLVFALKYDGVDLTILRKVFEAMDSRELEVALRARPSSAVLRRLWFFYEFLLDQRLALEDASKGAYVDALDPQNYITRPGAKLRRYRVNFNLLGASAEWCPLVRRTEKLESYEKSGLDELARSAVQEIHPRDLQRAIQYLYVKETRSSFELERATPSDRMERFVAALFSQTRGGPVWSVEAKLGHSPEQAQRRRAQGSSVWWGEAKLVEIAELIISDSRFVPRSYRTSDVRVAVEINLWGSERVHYVAPRHQDVPSLMAGFLDAWQAHHLMELPHPVPGAIVGRDGKPYGLRWSCGLPFVDLVMAGCLSFGFVYIHPFDDGNGRLHRLMLHHVLSTTGFTPPRMVIPISAAILHDQAGYDAALEDFSNRVMPFVVYTIDPEDGSMQVTNETVALYRYPDLTAQIEALCGWFESAVRTELVAELDILRAFDAARSAMREVVELPDRREALFLRLCVQNHQNGRGYKLSRSKREKFFSDLEDAEVAALENSIREAFEEVRSSRPAGPPSPAKTSKTRTP